MQYQEINFKTAQKMYKKNYTIFAIPGGYRIADVESGTVEPVEFRAMDYQGIDDSFIKAIEMFKFCNCGPESTEEPKFYVTLSDYKRRLWKNKAVQV